LGEKNVVRKSKKRPEHWGEKKGKDQHARELILLISFEKKEREDS